MADDYECDVCGASFDTEGDLKEHVQEKHDQED